MKLLKSPQKVIILFLSVLIIISSMMIVRLEGKAASLQAQWDKHKKSIEKNEDVLDKLNTFSRFVKNNILKIDDTNIMLIAGKTWFSLTNKDVFLETNGDLRLGTLTKPYIGFDKSGNIYLGANSDKKLGYDPSKNLLYMRHKNAHVSLGDIYQDGKSHGVLIQNSDGKNTIMVTDEEIVIGSKMKGGDYRIDINPGKDIVELTKGTSELTFEKNNVKIQVDGDIQIGPSKDRYIGYKANEDRLYMHHSGSEIFLGQINDHQGKPFANGIFMRGKDGGPYLTVNERNLRLIVPMKNGLYDITLDPENELLGLNCGKSFFVIEKDKIKMDAPGDINITSTNGNVNIKGKKVNLNE